MYDTDSYIYTCALKLTGRFEGGSDGVRELWIRMVLNQQGRRDRCRKRSVRDREISNNNNNNNTKIYNAYM